MSRFRGLPRSALAPTRYIARLIRPTSQARQSCPAFEPILARGFFFAGFRAALFAARAVMAVTALRACVVLSLELQRSRAAWSFQMSYHQVARIGLRARWLAIELVFYLVGLLTLGAQLASLLTSLPPT
jgi:hypothetical protein